MISGGRKKRVLGRGARVGYPWVFFSGLLDSFQVGLGSGTGKSSLYSWKGAKSTGPLFHLTPISRVTPFQGS